PTWYFKLTGSAEAVAKHETEFDKFITTVRLDQDPKRLPVFVLPEGWKLAGPRSIYAETIRIAPENLELTISGGIRGAARGNVQRWAEQVGMKVGPDRMGAATKLFDADRVKGLRVDVRGSKNPTASGPMMGGK